MSTLENKRRVRNVWTPELTESVVQDWKRGLSAERIARDHKLSSRGAVLGRLNRLGHLRKSKTVISPSLVHKTSRGLGIRESSKVEQERAAVRFDSALAKIDAHGDKAHVRLADLEAHHCRYPVGDPQSPDFGFCGQQVKAGKPYCPTHAERCYRPDTELRITFRWSPLKG